MNFPAIFKQRNELGQLLRTRHSEFFLDNQIFGHGFQSEIDRLKITITVQMKRVIPFPLELELASLAQG